MDNENLVADVCRFTLGKLGYDVHCAFSGEQAVAMAETISFDLAVVNRMLEGISGLEAFAIIRQTNPTLAGILITGHASLDVVFEAMKSGFSRVCKKPLDAKELVEAVIETLKIAEMRDDITRMKTLLPLYNLGERFFAAETEQAVYEELVDAVAREVNVPIVSVLMFDALPESLKVVANRGLDPAIVGSLAIKPGEKITGMVFQSSKPIILNRASQNLSPYIDLLKRNELSAAISFPIVSRGKVLGVLNVSDTRNGMEFSEADIEMLSIITRQAMLALENIRFIREREENSRIRALLEQYVSPEVSSLLMDNHQDLLEVGSVQELTVLFADIRNFTLLVQHLPPDHLRLFLNSFFELFAQTVFSFQGMLDKFMGDAVLVIFGAPVKIANPCLAAVMAAGKIMQEFDQLRVFWAEKDKVFEKVGLGIGISRGEMFLGNVGSARRLDYTVIGADVNIAQRLASETRSGQILLTDRVENQLGGQYPTRAEGSRRLKGIESEIMVYSLQVPP
jgi:adenylate cyclase